MRLIFEGALALLLLRWAFRAWHRGRPAAEPRRRTHAPAHTAMRDLGGHYGQARNGPADIAVSIVNYNTREHLAVCLASIWPERPRQVIVVDNSSTDGSAEMVARKFPWVTLIEAPNQGFGAGANLAISHATTPYVLLLNSDTRLHPGALFNLAAYLDARPRVGMVGPKLLNPDGTLQPSTYATPSPVAELMRWTSLSRLGRLVPHVRRKYFVDWAHDRPHAAGWVVGAALAIRKEAFDAAGGFDTSFFMYSEEVDLAYSMQRAGWEIHFAPVAMVTHVGGASTQALRAEMRAQLFASMHHFYQKHYSHRRQLQHKALITYFMLRNLARDRWRLMLADGHAGRELLAQDVQAWRQVLRLTWGL